MYPTTPFFRRTQSFMNTRAKKNVRFQNCYFIGYLFYRLPGISHCQLGGWLVATRVKAESTMSNVGKLARSVKKVLLMVLISRCIPIPTLVERKLCRPVSQALQWKGCRN